MGTGDSMFDHTRNSAAFEAYTIYMVGFSMMISSKEEGGDGSPSIVYLPLELVETILSFLSEPSDQLQASQVCSKWRDVMANLWWKRLMTWERTSSHKCSRPLFPTTSSPKAQKCALLLQVSLSVQLVGAVVVLPNS